VSAAAVRASIVALICAVTMAACGGRGDDAWPTTQPAASRTPAATTSTLTPNIPPALASSFPLTPTTTPAPTATPIPTGRTVTISAVGDLSLARQVNDWMAQFGAGYPYELVRHLFTGDIVFANLEGALTDRGEPWPKGFNFRTPPEYASGLSAAGIDIVALANNHAMDYGAIGLQDTILALDSAGVRHVGAGAYAAEAWNHPILDYRGLAVAFIACALTPAEGGGFTIDSWAAGQGDAPGIALCDRDKLEAWIISGREFADFIVVSIHAGDEYVNAPNATQRALADAALAADADLVLGHHAHVVQPVEQRGNQLIAWGLGNFIFDLDQWDLAGIPQPRVSLILNVTLTEGVGVTDWEAVPVRLDEEQDRPRPASPDEAAVLFESIAP
jgi:poly-gamma-glutamate synthesis protein (capsule biosynthesis protein)